MFWNRLLKHVYLSENHILPTVLYDPLSLLTFLSSTKTHLKRAGGSRV